jgi:hypothetical protein
MQKELFGTFLSEYGTHYVNYVVLGAKQMYSLEMKSENVLRLREMSIDVSKSTSSKTMFGYDRTSKVSAGAKVPGTPISVNVQTEIAVQAEAGVQSSDSSRETEEETNQGKDGEFCRNQCGRDPPSRWAMANMGCHGQG